MKILRKIRLLIIFGVLLALLLIIFFSGEKMGSKNKKRTNKDLQTQGGKPNRIDSTVETTEANSEQLPPVSTQTSPITKANGFGPEAQKWLTPIIYYGKVLDERNQPIAGVKVSFNTSSVNLSLSKARYDNGSVITDERGIFKIDGVRGIGMVFQISHSNYYLYPGTAQNFDFRDYPAKGILPDTEDSAILFRMHRKGKPVPLIRHAAGINVPLNGIPKEISLRGSEINQEIGKIIVSATGSPPERYSQQPFDWNAKISIPDGGLIAFTNNFDFVAPLNGYDASDEFSFPKEIKSWTQTISKNYFVKLPSGYMRLNIYIGAKSPLFFSIQYDYNPDGTRNLEPGDNP